MNDKLVFRIPLSKQEIIKYMLRVMQADNLINGKEEPYFTEMTQKGDKFLFEFIVPAPPEIK